MGAADHLSASLRRDITGFAQQVGYDPELRRQFVLICHLTHTVFDHGLDAAAVKRLQVFLTTYVGDELRIARLMIGGAWHLITKVGLDLEQARKVRFIEVQ